MKKIFATTVVCFFFCIISAQENMAPRVHWQQWLEGGVPSAGVRHIVPDKEAVFFITTGSLKSRLFSVSSGADNAQQIMLPMPDGSMRSFRIWLDNMMEPALAEKYPEIKTFSGYAENDKRVTVKLDYTEFGFHAMVFDAGGVYFIDPYSEVNDGFYSCYFKRDYARPVNLLQSCEVEQKDISEKIADGNAIKLRTHGQVRRDFRLALACTGEYAKAVAGINPTKSAVLSKMVTSMNRVNGVYERELAVHMNLVANNDTLIFLDETTDPYSNNNSATTMLNENPDVLDSLIGNANYDIGHVFSTGAGGRAQKASVCKTAGKARAVTGRSNPQGDPFDIDYVAHEMGHQFGADHTFNANTSNCAGNGVSTTAYEPGSGSTIMAYAGICGSGDNLQANSDAYFHAISLIQITDYLGSSPAACATTAAIANASPSLPPFSQSFFIPQLTPFEITAPAAADADHDTLTYCWEQWNLGNFKTSINAVSTTGPVFRSFRPDTSATRSFPKMNLFGFPYKGEELPDISRYLTFKLTVRDIYNGFGSFNIPDDSIRLDVVSDPTPFVVTSQSSSVNWLGSTTEAITWDVAHTDMPPVNCLQVEILLSVDSGKTFPYVLAANTPNDGSAMITVPNVISTSGARVKVKAIGNVFYNLNAVNFSITHNTGISNIGWENDLSIFPVPATDMLHIVSGNSEELHVTVTNVVGKRVFTGSVSRKLDISVRSWAKGVYYLELSNVDSKEKIIRPLVIN